MNSIIRVIFYTLINLIAIYSLDLIFPTTDRHVTMYCWLAGCLTFASYSFIDLIIPRS